MKKIAFPLMILTLLSCKHKEPTQADFMQRALKGADYKIVLSNFQTVNDSLTAMKKRRIDTSAVIYGYNTIAGNRTVQAKTIGQVVTEMDKMNKDSSFLKNVQRHLADTLAKQHRDSISN